MTSWGRCDRGGERVARISRSGGSALRTPRLAPAPAPAADVIVDAIDIPTVGEDPRRRVDCLALARWLHARGAVAAYVERAQAMPDQGASSGFNYGRGVGYLEATVQSSMIPLNVIETQAWKKHFGIVGPDKERARQIVIQRFPRTSELFERKKDHGRAEAVLIAVYGASLRGI